MATVSERIYQLYQVRREVSQTPDLAILLLARLVYEPLPCLPAQVADLVKRLEEGRLEGLDGRQKDRFARWLYEHLVVNKTQKGVSFYPIHPVLTLSGNGEGVRVEGFIQELAGCFAPSEREALSQALWATEGLPAFERALYDLIQWQIPEGWVLPPASTDRFIGCDARAAASSPAGILARAKDDLLALAQVTVGVQAFVAHAGRLLAFVLSRYLLAQAGVDLTLPIYAAPAADTHEGVRTLAHEIIEIHRKRFEIALREQFHGILEEALAERGVKGDPPHEDVARDLAKEIFGTRAKVIPEGAYQRLLQEHGSFVNIAYHYYWFHGGAGNRFLRQLHTTHLNLAKKAGFANSRSRYSQWHFYWLAPALIETLLLISQHRLKRDKVLMVELLNDWRERYGIAVLIDPGWEDSYRRYFPGPGSPEALNEANRRRFGEVLAERGRLHKNSDDFPWVILKD